MDARNLSTLDDDTRHFSRHELLSTSSAPLALVSAPQASFTVTTLADVVDANDGVLSLREAVDLANTTHGQDTITFDPALAGGTVRLVEGPLTITDALVIDGDPFDRGAGGIILDGNRHDAPYGYNPAVYSAIRVDGAQARLEDLTITNSYGIGITATQADVAVHRVTITANANNVSGTGIWTDGGTLLVADSVIHSNGTGTGSAIVMLEGAHVTVQDSDLGHSGSDYNTGIVGNGTLVVERSTIGTLYGATPVGINLTGSARIVDSTITRIGHVYSTGDRGTAIRIDGSLELINSTIADTDIGDHYGHHDVAAVALAPGTVATMTNTTITGTTSEDPSIIYGIRLGTGATLRIANSIVDDTIVGPGTLVSDGGNLFRDATVAGAAPTDVLGVTAEQIFAQTKAIGGGLQAGVLADNGGPTWTVALLDDPANPALNTADPAAAPPTDQRGFARDATPDIGAFELGAGPPPPPAPPLPDLIENQPLADSDILGAPRQFFVLGEAGDAVISFVDEHAGFQNSLGAYVIGPDGQILATQWLFARIEHAEPSDLVSAAKRPGGGPLSPGDAVALSDLFDPADLAPGTEFGLFLVADGAARNPFVVYDGGTLEFRVGDDAATVTDRTPRLVHIAENGIERIVLGDIMHTVDAGSPNPLSNLLNPGGRGQVTSGMLDDAFVVAFEDKPLAQGNRDFNDALFAIDLLDDDAGLFTGPAALTASAPATTDLATLITAAETI